MRYSSEQHFPVEYLREILSYDHCSGVLTWNVRANDKTFNTQFAGKQAGTVKKGYIQIKTKNKNGVYVHLFGHRVAWALYYGVWPSYVLDHKDCNGLNNRILNLREATSSQNSVNRLNVVGLIKYRGVYFMKHRGKYGAQIKYNKKHKWLGLFQDPKDAAIAYDNEAFLLHGEFAVTNRSLGLI